MSTVASKDDESWLKEIEAKAGASFFGSPFASSSPMYSFLIASSESHCCFSVRLGLFSFFSLSKKLNVKKKLGNVIPG